MVLPERAYDRLTVIAPLADRSSFEEFTDRYYSPLLHWLQHYTFQDSRCEDWCQSTFLKAWVHRRQFDGRKEVAWLYRIAQNVVRDARRADKLRPTISLDSLIGVEGDENGNMHRHPRSAVAEFPEQQVLDRLRLEQVKEVTEQFAHPGWREVIEELKQEYTLREMAAKRGRSRITVRGWLFRARKRLREQLKEDLCVA